MATISATAAPTAAPEHRPPPHSPWTEGHWLCGGETWRVVSVTDPPTAEALCIGTDNVTGEPLPCEAHRIEPLGANHKRALLTPHPQSSWAEHNSKIVLENVPRKGTNASDPRQLYRGMLIVGAGQHREFFILEGSNGQQDDTATLLLDNPDDSGANGGTASYRR